MRDFAPPDGTVIGFDKSAVSMDPAAIAADLEPAGALLTLDSQVDLETAGGPDHGAAA